MLKVELHAHTGDDPIDRIPHTACELIDRAATLGYDALALTLHERQADLRPLRSYAAERGVTLIPGIERTVEGGHVLLLNFSPASEEVCTFADLARLRGRERGLIVAPHPFFPAGHSVGRHLVEYGHLFDAIEWHGVFTNVVNFNRRAARWAHQNGKPLVGNCDVHRLYQLGTCYSLVDADRDPSAIVDAIRAGRVQVVSRPLSAYRAAYTIADLLGTDLAVKMGVLSRPGARPHPQPEVSVRL